MEMTHKFLSALLYRKLQKKYIIFFSPLLYPMNWNEYGYVPVTQILPIQNLPVGST